MKQPKGTVTVTTDTCTYIVAMMKDGKETVIKPLNTGKRYSRAEAMSKAEELNVTCQYELKHLDYDRFVAYSLYSE